MDPHAVDPQQILNLVQNPVFLLVAAWLAREMYALSKKKVNDYDVALKENTGKVTELTIAIVKLETRLESFEKLTELIPKMRGDLDQAHEKIRSLAPSGNA